MEPNPLAFPGCKSHHLARAPHDVVAMSYRCREYRRNEVLLQAHVKQLANLEARVMALEEGMPKLDSPVQ